MSCDNEPVVELWDEEAKAFINEHLDKVEVRGEGWEVVYRCRDGGRLWLEDFPHSEEHGGGPIRLRPIQE